MTTNIHLERICDTQVNVQNNLDAMQCAILSDQDENFTYSNYLGNKLYYTAQQKYWNGAAYTYCDNDFGEITLHNDLLVEEYIKLSGSETNRIRFEDDKITITAGGVDSLIIEDDNVHTDFYMYALGGLHVGGTSDPSTDNFIVDGYSAFGSTIDIGKQINSITTYTAGDAFSIYSESKTVNANNNYAFYADAVNSGAGDAYSFYGYDGEMYNKDAVFFDNALSIGEKRTSSLYTLFVKDDNNYLAYLRNDWDSAGSDDTFSLYVYQMSMNGTGDGYGAKVEIRNQGAGNTYAFYADATDAGDGDAYSFYGEDGLLYNAEAVTFGSTLDSGAITSTGAITDGAASSFTSGTTIGNVTIADGSITSGSGALDFGDENLSTTGMIQATAIGCGVAPDADHPGYFKRNDNSTNPELVCEQDGTGDASLAWVLTGGQGFSMGIDNSSGDYLRINPYKNLYFGTKEFVMNSAGNIGMGTNPSTTYQLYVAQTKENAAGSTIRAEHTQNVTVNSNVIGYSLNFGSISDIDNGITSTGTLFGLFGGSMHDSAGTYTGGGGTIAARLKYGSATGAGSSILAAGIRLDGYQQAAITTYYDILVLAPTGATAPTNDWCIYSEHNAPSRLIGDLQIDSDTSSLQLGATQNFSMAYNGTDVVFDSRVDGTGDYLFTNGYIRPDKVWHAYGGFEDQSETITCGTGDWNHITNAGNDLWNLDESDGITITADVFDIVNGGDYEGVLSLSISALNGKDFHVRIYNNTQIRVEGRPIGISTTGANNEMNVCVPIYIEATAGDDIQIEIMSADGTDPVVDDALFVLKYLHE